MRLFVCPSSGKRFVEEGGILKPFGFDVCASAGECIDGYKKVLPFAGVDVDLSRFAVVTPCERTRIVSCQRVTEWHEYYASMEAELDGDPFVFELHLSGNFYFGKRDGNSLVLFGQGRVEQMRSLP